MAARLLDPPLTLVDSPIDRPAVPVVAGAGAVACAAGVVELVAAVPVAPGAALEEDGSRPDSLRSVAVAPGDCASRARSAACAGSDLPPLALLPLALPDEVVLDADEDDALFAEAALAESAFDAEPFDEPALARELFDVAFVVFVEAVFVVVGGAIVAAAVAAGAGCCRLCSIAATFFSWPGGSAPALIAPPLPWPLPGFDVAAGASTAIVHAAISAATSACARDGADLPELLLCVDRYTSMVS